MFAPHIVEILHAGSMQALFDIFNIYVVCITHSTS